MDINDIFDILALSTISIIINPFTLSIGILKVLVYSYLPPLLAASFKYDYEKTATI
jgi:hypothetical protein